MADVTDTACGVVTLSAAGSSAEEMVRRVDSLDLEPVVFKLVHPEPGDTGLSVAGADQAVALYRGFLKLCALYPGVTLVPTRMWIRCGTRTCLIPRSTGLTATRRSGGSSTTFLTRVCGGSRTSVSGLMTSPGPGSCFCSTSEWTSVFRQVPACAITTVTVRTAASAASVDLPTLPGRAWIEVEMLAAVTGLTGVVTMLSSGGG